MFTEPVVDLLEPALDDPTRFDASLSGRLRRRADDELGRARDLRSMAASLPRPASTSAKRRACSHELQAMVFLLQSEGFGATADTASLGEQRG